MKDGQEKIFFCAGNGLDDVKASPFTERLIKKGYEVIYLTEPVDEYTIQGNFLLYEVYFPGIKVLIFRCKN